MFIDVNKVILLGNVSQDPRVEYTNSGKAVLKLSVATNRSYKKDEEWIKTTDYHNVVMWKDAEKIASRIQKGTRLYIEGSLLHKSYEKDGIKKYITEIICNKISLLSKYKDNPSNSAEEILGNDEQNLKDDGVPF